MAWAGYATIAKTEQKHVASATDRRVGTLDKHLPSPTTKFPQNAPKGRPIESDEEDNDEDGRSVDLHVPLSAPPPPAPRVLSPPLPLITEPTHAKGGASDASATGMNGARVAAGAPPPTDSLGDDEDNDDEGRPVDAHDEHVPLCARRLPRRPCSRCRRR